MKKCCIVISGLLGVRRPKNAIPAEDDDDFTD
jgi:hypothetical protein